MTQEDGNEKKAKRLKIGQRGSKNIFSHLQGRLLDCCNTQMSKFKDNTVLKGVFIEMKNRIRSDCWYAEFDMGKLVESLVGDGNIPAFPQPSTFSSDNYKKRNGNRRGKNEKPAFLEKGHKEGLSQPLINKDTAKKIETKEEVPA